MWFGPECALCSRLWVHMCVSPAVSGRRCLLGVTHPLLQSFFLCSSLSSLGEGFDEDILFGLFLFFVLYKLHWYFITVTFISLILSAGSSIWPFLFCLLACFVLEMISLCNYGYPGIQFVNHAQRSSCLSRLGLKACATTASLTVVLLVLYPDRLGAHLYGLHLRDLYNLLGIIRLTVLVHLSC